MQHSELAWTLMDRLEPFPLHVPFVSALLHQPYTLCSRPANVVILSLCKDDWERLAGFLSTLLLVLFKFLRFLTGGLLPPRLLYDEDCNFLVSYFGRISTFFHASNLPSELSKNPVKPFFSLALESSRSISRRSWKSCGQIADSTCPTAIFWFREIFFSFYIASYIIDLFKGGKRLEIVRIHTIFWTNWTDGFSGSCRHVRSLRRALVYFFPVLIVQA